jgi:mercuric ion binding protein
LAFEFDGAFVRCEVWIAILFSLSAGASEIRVPVKGMVCGFCAQGVSKKLRSEQAVEKVDVDLESQTVTVKLKDGQELGDEHITELLDDAGFTSGKAERTE